MFLMLWSNFTTILHETHNWLLIGLILLIGHFGGKLAQLVKLPSVVGYLVVGLIFGASVLDIINTILVENLAMISHLGLGIVAFLIGTELSKTLFKRLGSRLFVLILAESLGAFLLVFILVWICGSLFSSTRVLALPLALVFAAMAPASAPAGTVAVIQELKAKGHLTSLLLAVVGLDDGFAIIIYAFSVAGVKIILGGGTLSFYSIIAYPVLEILGGILVGILVGAGLALLSGKTRSRTELLTISLGAILITTGLANAFHLSLILANLAVGVTLVNLSSHEAERTYNSVKQITHPVYILFFVLAGAHLDLRILKGLSFLVPVYVLGRSLGKIGGAWLGASITKMEETIRKYLGLGILSQAGVAIALALMISARLGGANSPFGESGRLIASYTINTVTATTIFFEIIGPITTKIALAKASEVGVIKDE